MNDIITDTIAKNMVEQIKGNRPILTGNNVHKINNKEFNHILNHESFLTDCKKCLSILEKLNKWNLY